jgi:hypothetical protein
MKYSFPRGGDEDNSVVGMGGKGHSVLDSVIHNPSDSFLALISSGMTGREEKTLRATDEMTAEANFAITTRTEVRRDTRSTVYAMRLGCVLAGETGAPEVNTLERDRVSKR